MSKEDWIILRLLLVSVRSTPAIRTRPDVIKATIHLLRKYGANTVHDAIDALKEELK